VRRSARRLCALLFARSHRHRRRRSERVPRAVRRPAGPRTAERLAGPAPYPDPKTDFDAGSIADAVAAAETLIAIFLIFGFARKITYIAGALYSFGIWAIPEGFGNDDRAMSMDIGTAAVYVLVFLGLWAIDAPAGPRRFSLDALIEKRFPRRKKVAEVHP